jgi:hypothetical protein
MQRRALPALRRRGLEHPEGIAQFRSPAAAFRMTTASNLTSTGASGTERSPTTSSASATLFARPWPVAGRAACTRPHSSRARRCASPCSRAASLDAPSLSCEARPQGGDRRSARIEAHAAHILALIDEAPDISLVEISEHLQTAHGERCRLTRTLHKAWDRAHSAQQARARLALDLRAEEPGSAYDDRKIRLGNLALLEKPINIVAGNDFFAHKRDAYAKSANYLTRSLTGLTTVGNNTSINRINARLKEFDQWSGRTIDERHEMLRAIAAEVWAIRLIDSPWLTQHRTAPPPPRPGSIARWGNTRANFSCGRITGAHWRCLRTGSRRSSIRRSNWCPDVSF